jgi:hypothetical protein
MKRNEAHNQDHVSANLGNDLNKLYFCSLRANLNYRVFFQTLLASST